ncbi:MAG TPA: DinB family protein [Chitinophagaceae bacterium]|nr:DinB family protein [Chitinophagaceae bacterium]
MQTKIFKDLQGTTDELLQLLSTFSQEQINAVPFENSWTAGQVAEHITRSNASVVHFLTVEGKTTERKPDERAEELKKVFLDYTNKMKSPEFILPTQDNYGKENVIAELERSINQLKKAGSTVNLLETIQHPAFKEITKLELIHFAVYHTERHVHQLKNIYQLTASTNEHSITESLSIH